MNARSLSLAALGHNEYRAIANHLSWNSWFVIAKVDCTYSVELIADISDANGRSVDGKMT